MIDRSKANFGGSPASAWRARLDLAPADAGGAPTVSIVTPCRDGGAASFFETLEAVRGQSLQAFEWLLLVDPATPAHWGERIAELAARDPRLRVLEQREPLAAGAALAAAATQARAELVALLAPDEVLEPTALETLAACLSAARTRAARRPRRSRRA
jgi:cellulose synthase/poly-beta-1,6-N-acetylglucosamine synthase-like glycosyltransferase